MGVLRIAYPGDNRNGSHISKETFEKCINTIFNCPVVCNYDRETDSLGGHDVEVVRDDDGNIRMVNITDPIGCVPESSKIFWEEVEEEDGTVREYLCAEVLLWKRQEAYQKIKKDGITKHSMEITVKDGKNIDGVYHILDFEFTAFALIGVEPCFESSCLNTFSRKDFKQQLSEMMTELKELFSVIEKLNAVNAPNNGDDYINNNFSTEGGEQVLDRNELLAKYGIDAESLDFSIEDFTIEELEEKFKAMQETEPEDKPAEDFALMSNIVDEIVRQLSEIKIQKDWGETNKYWFVDCDLEAKEVYCWDTEDWLLYGFTYSMDGDAVIIDFESKKRKKYVIADFEGEQPSPIADVFAQMEEKLENNAGWEAKYHAASDTITSMEEELAELRKFKTDAENAAVAAEREKVFAQFEDLNGVEAFEALRENCDTYEVSELEEKCFAIRGRQGIQANFSRDTTVPKLKIDTQHNETLPYNGVFEKYGIKAEI